MRIAFFVQYCHEAGTYFRWHNLAKALVLSGHEVDVYAGDFNYKAKKRIEYRDNIRYIITPSLITSRIFGNPSDPFTALYRSIQQIEGDYDAYHLFQPFLQAFIPWYFLKLRKKGLYVYDWDDLWVGGIFKNANTIREKYTYRVVAFLEKNLPFIAETTTLCSTYLLNILNAKEKKSLIYNGFWSKHSLESKLALRAKFILRDDVFYLAYIGKTADELDWIYEGALNLANSNIQFELFIAGPPKEQVKKIGLFEMSCVNYLGEIDSEQAVELAKAVDLGLMPLNNSAFNKSRFPIKFFDFLSVGTPIYFSEVGEVSEIAKSIHGAISGSYNKFNWAHELPGIVSALIKSPIHVEIEHLEQNYSWPSLAKQLISNYEQQKKA